MICVQLKDEITKKQRGSILACSTYLFRPAQLCAPILCILMTLLCICVTDYSNGSSGFICYDQSWVSIVTIIHSQINELSVRHQRSKKTIWCFMNFLILPSLIILLTPRVRCNWQVMILSTIVIWHNASDDLCISDLASLYPPKISHKIKEINTRRRHTILLTLLDFFNMES